jgi:hypothetical protein
MDQLALFEDPAAEVDAIHRDLLDRYRDDALKLLHATWRAACRVSGQDRPVISSNDLTWLRPDVTSPLPTKPQLHGAIFPALARVGLLRKTGEFVRSNDRARSSRSAGRPRDVYAVTPAFYRLLPCPDCPDDLDTSDRLDRVYALALPGRYKRERAA